jgi:hypothetical protein
MTAEVKVRRPKTQTRRTREEAKVVRSMNFPVQFLSCSPVREAKLCPTAADVSLPEPLDRTDISGRIADQAAILAKRLYANDFSGACPDRGKSGKRLGCRSFQKVKEPLRNPPVFAANCNHQLKKLLCAAQFS